MEIFLGGEAHIDVPVLGLMSQLFVSLFLPIGLGMWLRTLNPERAEALAPRLQRYVFILIFVIVAVAIAISEPADESLFEGAGIASAAAVIWTVLAGSMGWGLGALLKLSPDERFTFAIEFAARNIAVTAIVAMSGLDRIDLTIFSGLYGAFGYPVVIGAALLRRRFVLRGNDA
jgi:predicted Na+-dependent transporter